MSIGYYFMWLVLIVIGLFFAILAIPIVCEMLEDAADAIQKLNKKIEGD